MERKVEGLERNEKGAFEGEFMCCVDVPNLKKFIFLIHDDDDEKNPKGLNLIS